MNANKAVITALVILSIALSAWSQWQPPVNCGTGVNGSVSDITPGLNLGGDTLYFSSARSGISDLYMSVLQGTVWQTATSMGSPINGPLFEFSPAIFPNGQDLYFASNRPGGLGGFDIWVSHNTGGVWGTPTNVGAVNTSMNDHHPYVSADGLHLYLSSDRAGGLGSYDIYVSDWTGAAWGTPVSIPGSVNSSSEDNHPSITQDGSTMYFSSNRAGGFGNQDIYTSTWTGTEWAAAVNLGTVINTTDFEQHPTVSGDGTRMIFASDRAGGSGSFDLWQSSFGPPDVWGTVSLEGNPPDLSGSIVTVGTISDTTDAVGYYFLPAVPGGQQTMHVTHTGYITLDTLLTDPSGQINVMLYLVPNLSGTVNLEGNPPDLSGSIVVVGTASDTTDTQGHYFIADVQQGTVNMEVSHTGYNTFDTTLVNPEGELNVMLYLSGPPAVFFDDFEGGMANWSGTWALTTESYHSPTHSLTDSPGGNYSSNQNSTQTMTNGVNLTGYQSAQLTYWTKYALETGFDYVYLDATINNGASWLNVRTFNGSQTTWRADTIDIGAFAGQPSLKFRFRLTSDGALEMDGLYVDDFRIEAGHEDNTPPLIVHVPDPDTTSWMGAQVIAAEITDVSGVASTSLYYRVDGGQYTETEPDSTSGDMYYFTIPSHGAGAWAEYYIEATDLATPPNTGESQIFEHIFGTILYYDDGEPEYIYQFAASNEVAVRFSVPQESQLVTLFFRFYKDDTHDIDTVDVYLWDNLGGFPNQVELGPLPLFAVNTLETPEAWTRLDLRSYEQVVPPEFHGGCRFRSTLPVILGDSPSISGRTNINTGTWAPATTDLHIRAVVGPYTGIPELSSDKVPTSFALLPVYPNPFNSSCVIPFALGSRDHVQLSVYNILGQKVATLLDGVQDAGVHRLVWDARGQSSGVYFLQLIYGQNSPENTAVRKLLLLR